MNIPLSVLSVIETALNTWLTLDGESLQKCEALEGKIIRLHVTGLELNLFFLPAVSGIQVMANYPDSALSSDQLNDSENHYKGEVDATIHGSPMALVRLTSAADSGASMLASDVEIDGEMRVAEKFSAILKEVDIDWEELFSKLVGDVFAHSAGEVVRSTSDWLSQSIEAMKLNTSEYLSEESKVIPADAELDYYMDQVDQIRMDVDRLEARIKNVQVMIDEKSDKANHNPKNEEK